MTLPPDFPDTRPRSHVPPRRVEFPTDQEILGILDDPHSVEWTVQGFGMLRAYLSEDEVWRLHVWDPEAAVQDVSNVHDHPWDFMSRIYLGTMCNTRFVVADPPPSGTYARGTLDPWWSCSDIRTGEGGFIHGPVRAHRLHQMPREILRAVDGERVYQQRAEEIHRSEPHSGCVTVVRRRLNPAKRDQARTFWQPKLDPDDPSAPPVEWVSAEPRPATSEEVERFANLALTSAGLR
jgi:hypothetical protein